MRSLSQSKLSRPPASTHAPAPCRSSSSIAASTEVGCSSSNAGITSRITAIVVSSGPAEAGPTESGLRALGRLKPAPTSVGAPQCPATDVGAGFSRPIYMCACNGSCIRRPCSSDIRMMSDVTGARRNASTPTASAIAFMHGAVAGADRRLAHAAGTDRRLRVGNVERHRLQPRRDVEDRQRFVVVEAPREGQPVLRVVHEVLEQRVRDPEAASAVDLRQQAARVDDRADVADAKEVNQRRPCPFRRRPRPPRSRRRTNTWSPSRG